MKTRNNTLIGWLLVFLLAAGINPLWAQEEADHFITISGVIRDKQNKKCLEYVNVSVPGTNIGTVTNEDGAFSLKLKSLENTPAIEISHIGYRNHRIPLDKEGLADMKIWLTPHANLLNEIVILAHNPRMLVEEAIKKIPSNYSINPNMLTGFYRETAQKGRRYINISEAVIDIYKTTYKESIDRDKVQIVKGRRLLSQKLSDTLGVKLLGGPSLSVYVDIVKNRDALLNLEELSFYNFLMEESVNIDNRPQYVISFQPRVNLLYALYYGKLYIDKERMAFTRAEFSLVMDDKVKAIQAMLYSKPTGLRFKPQELSFLVTYKYDNGVTYLNYIRNNIRFKCDWKRKLFATNYAVTSEMVVTDRTDKNVVPIPNKASFGIKDVFYDKVSNFENEDFWGSYNIIEPTESLEHAVYKLKKQSR